MTTRNVLKYAILYLGYDDKIDLDDKSVNENTVPELKTLLRCANLTYQELFSDYFPAFKSEKIKFTNGFIPYSELQERIIDIYGLYNNGNVKFVADALGIHADVDEAEITYSYALPELKLDSVIEIDGRLTGKIFALGICAEYCIINNLFDESINFDSRYKEGLKSLLRKKTDIMIKPRRWY